MNKQQITQAIDMFVTGQGNQAGLSIAPLLQSLSKTPGNSQLVFTPNEQ